MLTIKQTSELLGLKESSIRVYLSNKDKLMPIKKGNTIYVSKDSINRYKEKYMKRKEYVLYQGDNFIDIGTAKELAELLGVHEKTIRWYSTPVAIKRAGDAGRYAIILED